MAASLAYNFLGDVQLAYLFWESCERASHAGCMNVVAGTRLTGENGQRQDVRAALELHKRIYATGTKFQCAGAFSAVSIAKLHYFLGLGPQDDDISRWFARAYELSEEVGARQLSKDPCNQAHIEVLDYLSRLTRGTRNESLLRAARNRTESAILRRIIDHFLVPYSGDAVEAWLSSTTGAAVNCTEHFMLLWHATINNDRAAALRRYQTMSGPDGKRACAAEAVYARKFGL
jgi:hypothetical protein